MRRINAIIISLIMITAGIQVSIDRHYCDGKLSAVKLSVTGKMASCGMVNEQSSCVHENTFKAKCCEDKVTFYNISNKYLPEYFDVTHNLTGKNIKAVQAGQVKIDTSDFIYLALSVLPPGAGLKSDLSQSRICVFRI